MAKQYLSEVRRFPAALAEEEAGYTALLPPSILL